MREKEILIIEAAIRLFAKKGFSQTSIQEIANDCGFSKGAFYTYFKSKETLLPAIFHYYFEKMQQKVDSFENKNLPPRDKLIKQMTALYENLIEHKEFIIMQSKETAVPLNESVKKMMYKMQLDTYQFYQRSLTAIYGEKVERFLWDLAIIMQGMFQSYIRILLFTKNNIDLHDLSTFIVERVDDIVIGLYDKKNKPIITNDNMEHLLCNTQQYNKERIKLLMSGLKKELENIDNHDLHVTFDVLENEMNSDTPRLAVIQGMLSNLKELPQFDVFRQEIVSIFKMNS